MWQGNLFEETDFQESNFELRYEMSNINDRKFENGKQFSGRRGSTYKGRQDTAHARNWKGASVDRAPIMGEE